jgi:hypothetical protein
MKIEPILKEFFHGEGRGPELQQVHFGLRGRFLKAIDYFNPDDEFSPENLKHLVFIGPQVFVFTPEEVYNYASTPVRWGEVGRASMVVIHESTWIRSFAPQHLGKCHHYQIMFYDEYLDVICESIEAKLGGYPKQG